MKMNAKKCKVDNNIISEINSKLQIFNLFTNNLQENQAFTLFPALLMFDYSFLLFKT